MTQLSMKYLSKLLSALKYRKASLNNITLITGMYWNIGISLE